MKKVKYKIKKILLNNHQAFRYKKNSILNRTLFRINRFIMSRVV